MTTELRPMATGISGDSLHDLSQLADSDRLADHIRDAAWDRTLALFYLGRRPFKTTWELQQQLHAWRLAGQLPDTVLLLEHDPVYTIGKNGDGRNLLARRPADADVIRVDRGGDVTYHGPGQLVGYPIINLEQHRPSVTWYMRGLEGAIIAGLADLGLNAERMAGLTGVWVQRRKVAALGVRLSRWTTTHGFAINISVPVRYFDGMVPCGILEYGVGNLNDYLPAAPSAAAVARSMVPPLKYFLEG